MDVKTMFSGHFTLHWILLVPALLILVMAAFRAKVKYTLLAQCGSGGGVLSGIPENDCS